jgi:RNA polymerase sigma-70 factor (ECF subfamily)
MEIYTRYAPALLRKCQRMLQNQEDAEDIVQGLFADMLSKGQAVADLPYLYRAVTNRCINFLRYGVNRRRLLERQDELLRGPVRIRCDEHVIGMDLLLKLVDGLDSKCRETLVYRFFDEMTQEEIAGLMSTSRKTVGKRLKKIHAQVRDLVHANREGGA